MIASTKSSLASSIAKNFPSKLRESAPNREEHYKESVPGLRRTILSLFKREKTKQDLQLKLTTSKRMSIFCWNISFAPLLISPAVPWLHSSPTWNFSMERRRAGAFQSPSVSAIRSVKSWRLFAHRGRLIGRLRGRQFLRNQRLLWETI